MKNYKGNDPKYREIQKLQCERLAILQKKLGLKTKQFAAILGRDITHIYNVKSQYRGISKELISSIAMHDFLNYGKVNMNWLIGVNGFNNDEDIFIEGSKDDTLDVISKILTQMSDLEQRIEFLERKNEN